MLEDEFQIYNAVEAIEAIQYCSTDYEPLDEILKIACRDMSEWQRARIDLGLSVAEKLGYIESIQHGAAKRIRLSQKGLALVEQLRHKFDKDR
jgi:hypothetical protein